MAGEVQLYAYIAVDWWIIRGSSRWQNGNSATCYALSLLLNLQFLWRM